MFQCETCSNETMVQCDRGRIDEPTVCTGCAGKFTMKLLHNRCGFMNKQLIKMQVQSSSLCIRGWRNVCRVNVNASSRSLCCPASQLHSLADRC